MSPRTAARKPNPRHVQAAVELAYIEELLLVPEPGLTFEPARASYGGERPRSERTRAGAALGIALTDAEQR